MFGNYIKETPLTTPDADNFFESVNASPGFSDASFVTTARVLLSPRIPPKEGVFYYKQQTAVTAQQIAERDVKSAMYYMLNDALSFYEGVFLVSHIGSAEDYTACTSLLESSLEREIPGWEEVKKVREYYKKEFDVLCYVNEEIKTTIIFTHKSTLKKEHSLQISLPLFTPWYFAGKNQLIAAEVELLKSLSEDTPDKYLSIVEKFAKKYDFRKGKIERLLAGFGAARYRSRKTTLEIQLANYLDEIKALERAIQQKMEQCDETEILIEGLARKIESAGDDNELIDYFNGNKHLFLESANASVMTFSVVDYITYFDEEKAEKYIRRMGNEDKKKLMKAVFLDGILKIRTCAAFSLDPVKGVCAKTRHIYPSACNDCFANPHIDSYGCIAGYVTMIDEALRSYDYITATEQCITSTKSLNFSDSIVMSSFEHQLIFDDCDKRFFEAKDGTRMNADEALEFLKGMENE